MDYSDMTRKKRSNDPIQHACPTRATRVGLTDPSTLSRVGPKSANPVLYNDPRPPRFGLKTWLRACINNVYLSYSRHDQSNALAIILSYRYTQYL